MGRIKGTGILLLLLFVIFFFIVPIAKGYSDPEEEWDRGGREGGGRREEREREEFDRGSREGGGRREEREREEFDRGSRGSREEREGDEEWDSGDRGDRGSREEREAEQGGSRRRREERGQEAEDVFLLHRSERILKTEAGEMRVVRGPAIKGRENPIHIGFISMEPKTLLVPQYVDSNLILFVRRGEVKIGRIQKDELVERQLKMGDIYIIPAGSTFYMLNTGEGQRLHIICGIDTSESIGRGPLESFFIAGGTYPQPLLAGFDRRILRTALNISDSELDDFLTKQNRGPILYVSDAKTPGKWASFLQLKQRERLEGLQVDEEEEEDTEATHEKQDEKQRTWSWRKLLESVFGNKHNNEAETKGSGRSYDSYNLYDRSPDFQNDYGWSLAVNKHDYPPLKHPNVGVYLVNLTAGSMMAPHVNPRATEYGIILSGEGSVQVVFPNGSLAMNAKVHEGDVFVVPRYFPFCQIASRGAPMEFFGFTTSAKKNRPQFLIGANSILQTLRGPELAAAFGVSEQRLNQLLDSQDGSVVLPTAPAVPPEKEEQQEEEDKKGKHKQHHEEEGEQEGHHDSSKGRLGQFFRNFGNHMVMGFD